MAYANKADRNYKQEYLNYDGTEAVKKRRAERNAAHREMEKKLGHAVPKGFDVDHKVALTKGGGNAAGNLRIKSASANRSFDRNADHSLKSNSPPPKKKK